jgi:hypothetical protein
MSAWADAIARRWTGCYTRRVDAELAARRRAEIRSDLHDHAAERGASHGQQWEVLGRVLWGIPADLSWRRAARVSRPRARTTGASMKLRRVTLAVLVALVAFLVWAAIGALHADGGGIRYTALFALAVAAVGAGIALRDRAPGIAAFLMLAGAAAPMAIFYWMAPVFVPGFLVVAALVVVTQLRRRRATPAA